jgi:alpha-beta hydrolase superfamily lysophospholipase
MIGPIGKWIDWSVLQLGFFVQSPSDESNPQLQEALEFLRGPDFIPTETQVAGLTFDDAEHFRFPTLRPSRFAQNNTVYGQLYRCPGNWQQRGTIVLLHGGDIMRGGNASLAYRRFPRIARLCNRAGYSAARLVAPCHFQRQPHERGVLDDLNYLRMAEIFFAQGVADIRAFVSWLFNEGVPAVALWGVSYGGWLAGLTVCHDARLTAAVLTMPGVCLNHLALQNEKNIWRRQREALRERNSAYRALDTTPLSLLTAQPVIPKNNLLLIEGIYDQIAAPQPIEDLWQAWSHPELWRLPHGHLSWMASPGIASRVIRWLGPRL